MAAGVDTQQRHAVRRAGVDGQQPTPTRRAIIQSLHQAMRANSKLQSVQVHSGFKPVVPDFRSAAPVACAPRKALKTHQPVTTCSDSRVQVLRRAVHPVGFHLSRRQLELAPRTLVRSYAATTSRLRPSTARELVDKQGTVDKTVCAARR